MTENINVPKVIPFKPATVLRIIPVKEQTKAFTEARRELVADSKSRTAKSRMDKRIRELRRAEMLNQKLIEEARGIMKSELKKNGGPNLKVPMVGLKSKAIETFMALRPFLPSFLQPETDPQTA